MVLDLFAEDVVLEPTGSPPLSKHGGEQRRRNPRLGWFELIDLMDAFLTAGIGQERGRSTRSGVSGMRQGRSASSTFKAVWGGRVAFGA
jgi:hypothetical protein